MKKFIVFLGMLFLTTMIYAKQFCVKINCEEIIGVYPWGAPEYGEINIEEEINKYLNKGYKLITIIPKITTNANGYTYTKCFYCIFDDGN